MDVLKIYKVTIKNTKLYTFYVHSEQDIVDIIENPEYGEIQSVELITIYPTGYYKSYEG